MIFIISLFVLGVSVLSSLLPEPALFLRPYLLLICVWIVAVINRPHIQITHLLLIAISTVIAAATFLLTPTIALDPQAGAMIITSLMLLGVILYASYQTRPTGRNHTMLLLAGLFLAITTALSFKPAMAELAYIQAAYSSPHQSLNSTLEQLSLAERLNPKLARYHQALSRAHLKAAFALTASDDPAASPLLSKHIQAAIYQAQQTVRYGQGSADSWAQLGQTYLQLIGPVPDAHLWAQASLERAIKRDPTNADYPLALAQVYIKSNQAALALPLLKELLSRFPTDPRPAFLLGTALRETDPTQSLIYYRLSLEHARDKDKQIVTQEMRTLSH